MPIKSVTSEMQDILNSLPHMTSNELEIALERLSSFGIEQPEGPVRRPGISCPFTQMQVVSPCNLSSCRLHIENEWSRNCLLEYLDTQNSDALAVEEIAYLYSSTSKQVEATIEQAMSQLRENSEETVGIVGDFRRPAPKVIKANVDDRDEISITSFALSPPFLGEVNKTLGDAISDEVVFQHPAIKVLGILDTIINEID